MDSQFVIIIKGHANLVHMAKNLLFEICNMYISLESPFDADKSLQKHFMLKI